MPDETKVTKVITFTKGITLSSSNTEVANRLRRDGLVSNLLTLSIRHLPEEAIEDLRDSACAYPNADHHDSNGCFFVWADRLFSDEDPSVQRIGELANCMSCSYVFFDRDAEPSPGLAVFKEPDDEEI